MKSTPTPIGEISPHHPCHHDVKNLMPPTYLFLISHLLVAIPPNITAGSFIRLQPTAEPVVSDPF
jgi:hypothetical protein